MAAKDAATGSSVTEYNIRVPKNQKKKYQVMRYNSSLNIDFQKWSQVKMERENNQREFKGPDEEQPKFGAGSEFGRDAREEARRKKFGIVSQRYKSEAQPWLIKAKQAGKSYGYRGVREGGIAENASYYVFTHAPDGGIDAYPLTEWYNFQPVHRYKALSAEEAEDEFGRRNKLMNYFSVMTRKRCRGVEEDAELDDPDDAKAKKSGGKKKELKISDMDDWMDSSDEDEDGSGSDKEKDDKDKDEIKEEKDKKKKMKEKAANQKKKKKKKDFDDEAFEESDDGDEEGREVDYISDSSDSESDHEGKARKELQGVSEEKALRNLLSSGSSDEEDAVKTEKLSDAEEGAKEGAEKEGSENADKDAKDAKKKKKKKKEGKKKKGDKKAIKKEDSKVKKEASSSEFSSDSDTDSELEAKRRAKRDSKEGAKPAKEGVKEAKEVKDVKESTSGGSSRSCTPSALEGGEGKRKAPPSPSPAPSAKKPRLESAPASAAAAAASGGDTGITEDAVRRYLMRKPMTTTELLQKFKSKKTGLSSEQLVNVMTQILKRINPVKQTIKGKMYLSIKR